MGYGRPQRPSCALRLAPLPVTRSDVPPTSKTIYLTVVYQCGILYGTPFSADNGTPNLEISRKGIQMGWIQHKHQLELVSCLVDLERREIELSWLCDRPRCTARYTTIKKIRRPSQR